MDLGSILLILSLLILVVLYVSRPLFERGLSPSAATDSSVEQQEHEISALLAERDRILNSLQELDFDYSVGKIPEETYPQQRANLLMRGAEVLRRLDVFQGEGQAVSSAPEQIADHEARLEAAIAERRGRQAIEAAAGASSNGHRNVVGAPDDPLEIQLAARRRARQEKAAGFCPQCGGPVQKSDQFCPKCGARLKSIA